MGHSKDHITSNIELITQSKEVNYVGERMNDDTKK